jgi:signal transduction histidine kinase/ligand-binding sensor domain-containing protein/DNA-binding response OmpR family regulator
MYFFLISICFIHISICFVPMPETLLLRCLLFFFVSMNIKMNIFVKRVADTFFRMRKKQIDMKTTRIALFLFLLVRGCPVSAQEMSSHLIRSICQDARGFIWVATEYGLNKFDGITCKQYLHDDGDSTSVADNNVHKLLMDTDRHLWLCCINGLQRYDAERDAFVRIRFPDDAKPHVTDLKEFPEEFWIATSGRGLFRLKKGASEAVPLDEANRVLGSRVVSCIHEDRNGTLWIGTINNRLPDSGLFRIHPDTGEALVVELPGMTDHNINAMAEDSAGRFYVGTSNAVLFYDTLSGQFKPLPCRDEGRISVRCMATGADGRIFVGTEGQGLQCIDSVRRQLFTVDDAQIPFNFRRARIHALLEDRNGHWWVGCFQRGIFQVSSGPKPFDFRSFQEEASGKGGFLTSIYKDSSGDVWCGLTDEGIFRLNASGAVEKHFPQPPTAVCLFEDSRGQLWVGAYDQAQLAVMDKQSGRCRRMSVPQGGYIKAMIEDGRQCLYLSTFGSGFIRYNLQTNAWETIDLHNGGEDELKNFWINTLLCDSKGLIWLGHYQGVSCYDPEQDGFVREPFMEALSGQITLSMLEDRTGALWLGTYNGLFRIDRSTSAIRNYTTADGLSNNVICGLVEDEQGAIWCSTFQGISQLKDETIVNYQSGNGLRDKVYTRGVYFRDRDGRIYFGGNTGLTSFLPDRIPAGDYRCEIVTTGLYIHNQPVSVRTRSGGRAVTDIGVNQATAFRFAYEDNTFTFEFSTMDFLDPQNVHYEYRLKELSDSWSATLPGIHRMTYNHLPAGKYTLEVRACKYGSRSPVKQLALRIAPPWYQSRLAWSAYLLLLLAAILLVVYALNKKRKEMLNEAKLRFFIDISHEIRSPMTLLIHPLEKLLKNETDAATRKALATIDRNARRILGLINQLLDVRKIDKGQMHLTFSETDVVAFIAELLDMFEEQAAGRHIRLRFEHPAAERLPLWIDRNNFDKVLMNLLSNAFRFTPDGGAIDLLLTSTSRHAEIRILDSGPGIPEEQIERIFTRFYQAHHRLSFGSLGSGIGLNLARMLVELHQGTLTAGNRSGGGSCFILRLPLGNSHLRKESLTVDVADTLFHCRSTPVDAFLPPADEPRKAVRSRTNHRILIVDDDPEVRHLLRQELETGYRVLSAGNGKEALPLAVAKLPDVIVADVRMPEMDGLELVKQLRNNIHVSHIPIILLSSKAEHADRMRGLDKGADAYLTKPFDMEELLLLIHNLINNRRRMKGKFSGAQDQEGKIKALNFKSADELLMDRILAALNHRIDDSELTVEQLAVTVGLSRVQLHRKLKEIAGIPTSDFIRNLRLKKAAELLREKKMNVSQIAYAVGFANQTHFSTSFKKFYGLSPTAYMASGAESDAIGERPEA